MVTTILTTGRVRRRRSRRKQRKNVSGQPAAFQRVLVRQLERDVTWESVLNDESRGLRHALYGPPSHDLQAARLPSTSPNRLYFGASPNVLPQCGNRRFRVLLFRRCRRGLVATLNENSDKR